MTNTLEKKSDIIHFLNIPMVLVVKLVFYVENLANIYFPIGIAKNYI